MIKSDIVRLSDTERRATKGLGPSIRDPFKHGRDPLPLPDAQRSDA